MSRAFANGTEWDCWSASWCNRCAHEDTCPLLDQVLIHNEVPEQWVPDEPGSLWKPYICTEFEQAAR